MMISIDRVSYTYPKQAGRACALADLSVALQPGVTGIVGANGAGKTTLLRLLLGALVPDTGSLLLGGKTPDRFRRTGQLGFIPDHPAFPAHLTVLDFLSGLAALQSAEFALPASLQHLASARLGGLSLGEARRVELQAAMIGGPKLLILDEPTNGLDPRAVMALRNELRAAGAPDRIIMIASHHIDELQRIADWVLILDSGRLAGFWKTSELAARNLTIEDLLYTPRRSGNGAC